MMIPTDVTTLNNLAAVSAVAFLTALLVGAISFTTVSELSYRSPGFNSICNETAKKMTKGSDMSTWALANAETSLVEGMKAVLMPLPLPLSEGGKTGKSRKGSKMEPLLLQFVRIKGIVLSSENVEDFKNSIEENSTEE
ncbi:uncharacterized protein A4U43_C03F13610 [Asparagus officinalis]|uniref:Uncharacterized protein n=1 Tax=Asparagus officinalis TaxID=4686 RepID=A0A5P1FBK0_ASPOF|nr:uncharacterized protein A4U43_C03F13610 [Asparagus officinalis]